MSDLTVTGELIAAVKSTVLSFDQDADDPVRHAQYLAALMAIAVSDLPAKREELIGLHGQLASFSYDILEQQLHARKEVEPSRTPAGVEIDPSMIPSGVWKP